MPGRFRHTLIRALLRNVLKPLATPSTPLPVHRAMLDAASLSMRAPRGLTAEDEMLDRVPARRLAPRHAAADRHMLYLHGGAYISGSPRSHAGLAGQVAAAGEAIGWLIDYRLAPEHSDPAAEQDALAAYRALLARGIAPGAIVIAGDSAGGGLTLATALAIRDAGLPMPAALVLLSPWTDLTLSGRSVRDKCAAEPMLNATWLDWSADAYCGAFGDGRATLRTHPGVSPLFGDLRGLPPLLVHVGSDEILLDDATGLADLARAAGVDVTLRVFDGLWHVFQAQAGVIAEADESIAEIGAFIRQRAQPL